MHIDLVGSFRPRAVAMAHIAKMCGFQNAIVLDIVGTSSDVSLMYQGEIRVTQDWSVEPGHPIRFPSIELITIGAGGGSIAWVDDGGSFACSSEDPISREQNRR
jgi:N-methylhydantoinase A